MLLTPKLTEFCPHYPFFKCQEITHGLSGQDFDCKEKHGCLELRFSILKHIQQEFYLRTPNFMSDLKRRSSSGDRNLWRSGGAPTGLPRCQVCQGEAQHRCPTRSQSRPRSARRRNLDNLLSSTCNLLWTDSDDWPSMTMFCFL